MDGNNDIIYDKNEVNDKSESLDNDFTTRLEESVQKIIENEAYIDYEITKRPVSTNNSSYLGVLYTIDVKGNTKDGFQDTNLFVKVRPNDFNLKVLDMVNIYEIESFVYKDFFKVCDEIQEEANIPLEERYKSVKCYEESIADAIIMDNVAIKGYNTISRMKVVSLEYAQLAIKALAKFHALSFAVKEKRPYYFESKMKSMKCPIIFNNDWLEYSDRTKNIAIEFIDDEYKGKIKALHKKYFETYCQYVNDDSVSACLVHGDYRPSNIMTKIENGVIKELIPLDYQLVYYGCPVYDFIYFLYMCTDRDFRKANMADLKDLYYETLTDFLKLFDVDVKDHYTRSEFDRVFKERLDIGLIYSLYYTVFMFMPEADVPDMVDIKFQVDDSFKERIDGIIEDYVEWGYI